MVSIPYAERVLIRTQQAYACDLQVVAPAVLEYPFSGDRISVLRSTQK